MLIKKNNTLFEIIDAESNEPIPDDDYITMDLIKAINYVVHKKCTFELRTYEKDVIDLYKNALLETGRNVEILKCTDRNVVDLDK